jgi:Ycf4
VNCEDFGRFQNRGRHCPFTIEGDTVLKTIGKTLGTASTMTSTSAQKSTSKKEEQTFRTEILGSRRFSNYFWAIVVTIGATGFSLASLSSYFHVNLLPFADPLQLVFLPQGLAMGLYGTAGLLLAFYIVLTILWNLGGGYNEFNKTTKTATIFRWGFPGKNRKVELSCKLEDIQAVKVTLKEGINPKRAIYLRVKGMRDIPLTRVGQPISLSSLETQAAELVRFLGVPLEGL